MTGAPPGAPTGTPPEVLLSGLVLLVQKQLLGEITPEVALEAAKELTFVASDTPTPEQRPGEEGTKGIGPNRVSEFLEPGNQAIVDVGHYDENHTPEGKRARTRIVYRAPTRDEIRAASPQPEGATGQDGHNAGYEGADNSKCPPENRYRPEKKTLSSMGELNGGALVPPAAQKAAPRPPRLRPRG